MDKNREGRSVIRWLSNNPEAVRRMVERPLSEEERSIARDIIELFRIKKLADEQAV